MLDEGSGKIASAPAIIQDRRASSLYVSWYWFSRKKPEIPEIPRHKNQRHQFVRCAFVNLGLFGFGYPLGRCCFFRSLGFLVLGTLWYLFLFGWGFFELGSFVFAFWDVLFFCC